jgi:hypothetical protein
VVGVDRTELANWYPQLVKSFDSIAPTLIIDLNLQIDNKTVVALLFETANAPFVIKVQNSDRLEIPWREGTRTRSATRAEVLRIFSVLQQKGTLSPIAALSGESARAQNLAIERPPFWEYLLTLELLAPKLRHVRRKYDDVRSGRTVQKTRILSGKDFYRVMRERMNDLSSWMTVFKSCIELEIPASWGKTGEPGDPVEIKHAADKFISAANNLVEWETEVLSLKPPDIFERLQSLLTGVTSRFLESMEEFSRALGEPVARGNPEPGQVINLNLVIDFPEGKIDEMTLEMERVTNLIKRDPERWVDQWNDALD